MQIPKLFQLDTIVVNQKVAMFQFGNQYQLQDSQGSDVGFVQENVPGWAKVARLFLNKAMLPFELDILDENQTVVAKIKRGFTLFMSKVEVQDGAGKVIGTFKGKMKLMGSRFDIHDQSDAPVGKIEGNWKGWEFKITDNTGNIIGNVNKKWAGGMKELFTTADKYKVEMNPQVQEDENKVLMVSVAIAVDMIMKNN